MYKKRTKQQIKTHIEDLKTGDIKNSNEEVLSEFSFQSLVTHVEYEFEQLLEYTLTQGVDAVFHLW